MPTQKELKEARPHQHLFRIVDEMIDSAEKAVHDRGDQMSCKKGCDHCCHLLIEISWEEATEMSLWLSEQPEEKWKGILARIADNSFKARPIFEAHKKAKPFLEPAVGEVNLPDKVYDAYFYESKPRPCPMLEDGVCQAYDVRPTPCRLHMVTSPVKFCQADQPDAEEYEVPEELEEVQSDVGSVIGALERDGRWGHFATVLQANIIEMAKKGRINPKLGEEMKSLKKALRA